MVGLIPKTYFLHLYGDETQKSLKNNEQFVGLCQKENIEIIDALTNDSKTDQEQVNSLLMEYKPAVIFIEENLFSKNFSKNNYQMDRYMSFKIIFIEPSDTKNNLEKSLAYLKQGADEVMTRDRSAEEIFIRCYSFLRRKSILEQNQLTSLPSINRTYAVIDHCRQNLSDWVVMHIDTLNIKSYTQMYGIAKTDEGIKEIAKMLQASVLGGGISETFVGHLGRDNFIVVCDSNSMDKILANIYKNFDKILTKLYKKADCENGYIISAAPNKIRRKEGLLHLNIGSCNNIDRNYLSGTDVIEQAIQNKKKLTSPNKKILILEDDNDFANLVAETLSYEGLDVKVSKGFDKLIGEIKKYQPKILVLEAKSLGIENFKSLCKSVEEYKKEFGLKILVATNVPGYQNFLDVGADVYLPKPYDLEVLFREVRRLRFTFV